MWCEIHHIAGENAALAIFDAMIDQLALACGEFNSGFKYSRFRDACYAAAKLPIPIDWGEGEAMTDAFQICCLARWLSKKAIRAQLRSEGIKVSWVEASEVAKAATAYLSEHPEIFAEAKVLAEQINSSKKPRGKRVVILSDGKRPFHAGF
jgi:hypothetical protein